MAQDLVQISIFDIEENIVDFLNMQMAAVNTGRLVIIETNLTKISISNFIVTQLHRLTFEWSSLKPFQQ